MGLGGATKKLQKVADMGEELYARMNELREQIVEVRETVQDTHERVAALENKVDQQEALLEALAENEGINVDELLTEVAIEEAEPAITEAEDDTATVPDAEADGNGTDTDDEA
jgi:uncharacterized coiled-coil DUF342 family protein